MIMSAFAKISAAVSMIVAPAFSYISLVSPIDLPPSRCTITWWPCATSSRAPAGVRPMRYSWFLISLGTPMSIFRPPRAIANWVRPPVPRAGGGIVAFVGGPRGPKLRQFGPLGPPTSGGGADRVPELLDDLPDVRLIEDQRRRQRNDIAG